LTRITAFQVCASLDVKDALSLVLGAAQQGETESVKLSAVGALGLLGNKDQIPFLNNILQGKDERLKAAAQQALHRINQKLEQGTRTTAKAG
jgi:HEAT repeat protein